MTIRKTFEVKVTHPTNFHQGKHTLTVIHRPHDRNSVSVDGTNFGCGRDQFNVTDEQAIRNFLSEHACNVTSIKQLTETSY